MEYIISASTDIGLKKHTNQDSLSAMVFNTQIGKFAFAVLCDGMGGLAKGEVASTTLVNVFRNWAHNQLPQLCNASFDIHDVQNQWLDIVHRENQHLLEYGKNCCVNLGTTLIAILLTNDEYLIMNIGDSRAYEISDSLYQITQDQTVVEQEIRMGILTPEQAESDPRRNVLLQCVGALTSVEPDCFFGKSKRNAVYMLCSDGFRHVISSEEIFAYLAPNRMNSETEIKQNLDALIELNKRRNEQDNISVIAIRTF